VAAPLEYNIIGFGDNEAFTGEIVAELAALADAGTIRIVDLVFIARGDDGSAIVLEVDEHSSKGAGFPRTSPPNSSQSWPRRTEPRRTNMLRRRPVLRAAAGTAVIAARRDQGVLTDSEFDSEKSKILAG
jgi:hypothetical protein